MNVSQTIILGVISGLLTGFFAYFLSSFMKKVILPWFKKVIYSGIDLGGTWIVTSEQYDRRDITLELKQNAGELHAISTHVLRDASQGGVGEKIRTYHLDGDIKDRFIILKGRPNDPTRIGALTFVFEVVGDGKTLRGVGSAYSSSMMEIDSRKFIAQRVKSAIET